MKPLNRYWKFIVKCPSDHGFQRKSFELRGKEIHRAFLRGPSYLWRPVLFLGLGFLSKLRLLFELDLLAPSLPAG